MGRQRWYSDSCDTCHKRHVKCDKVKPDCQVCTKAGIRCIRRYRYGLVHLPRPEQPMGTVSASISSQTPAAWFITTDPKRWLQTPSQWPLYQQQILATFLSEYIPQETTGRGLVVAGHPGFSWFRHLPEEHGKRRLTKTSAIILSLNFLGTKYGNDHFLYWSERYYQRLLEVITQLKYQTEDLIPIATTLSMHGLYSTSSMVDPWMVHVRFASEFLRERGPDRPIDHHLYCLIGTSVLYDSCGLRKSTFLSLPEWQKVAPDNGPFERALSMSMFIPSIEELSDDIRAASYSPERLKPLREKFLRLFVNTFTKFRHWYLDLLKYRDACPFTIRAAGPGDLTFLQNHPGLEDVFPEVIEFPDQYTFQILLLCWTGYFVLYAEAAEVMRILDTNFEDAGLPWGAHCTNPGCISLDHERDLTRWPCSPAQDAKTAIQEVQAMATIFATRICQVTAFCDKYPGGSSPRLLVLSPLWLVQQFFERRSEKRWIWCKQALSCFPSRNVGFGQFLSNLSYRDYPSREITENMPTRYARL